MASKSRAVRLCLLAAAAAGALLLSGGSGSPLAAISLDAAKQKAANFILVAFGTAISMFMNLLPGACLGLALWTAATKRQELTRRSWALILSVILASIVLWAVQVRVHSDATSGGSAHTEAMVGPVHSGEVICTEDGRYLKLPDPTKKEGEKVETGWQRNLAKVMTDAIRLGREQVVLVFSRQGCPWCERLLPVMYRAIQARAQDIAESGAGSMSAPGTAFVGGGLPEAAGMLLSPLRVFVLDASEFPYLLQQFRIEAFPTSMFFGRPGVPPLMAQGYLNDDQIQEILQQAALAVPQVDGDRPRKRRPFFR